MLLSYLFIVKTKYGFSTCLLKQVKNILYAYMKAQPTDTHPTNAHRLACTHSTNEDENLAASLVSSLAVSLPPAIIQSKKFEVFVFYPSWTVKQSNTMSLLTIISVPLFSSSEHFIILPLPRVLLLFQVSLIEPLPIANSQKLSIICAVHTTA